MGKALNAFNKKDRKFNHLRLRTQQNLFDGDGGDGDGTAHDAMDPFNSINFDENDPFGVQTYDGQEVDDPDIDGYYSDEQHDRRRASSDQTDRTESIVIFDTMDPEQCGAQDLDMEKMDETKARNH